MKRFLRKLLGSFLSVLCGWVAGAIVLAGVWSVNSLRSPWDYWIPVVLVSGMFDLAVWALIFWPLYVFIPRRSLLWSPPVCGTCGAAAGAAIQVGILGFQAGTLPFVAAAAATGGATGLFAAMTAGWFHRP